MSKRAEKRRAEKAMKKLQNKKFTLYEVQELMNRSRIDTLKLAVGIHEKTNVERARETRKNQFHLLLERQVRMRFPAINKALDESDVFMKREGGGDYESGEAGSVSDGGDAVQGDEEAGL